MIQGIDISHYQMEIDWPAVAASGIQFAFIKATEGTSYVDPMFATNAAAARAAGILIGAYHFLEPGNIQAQMEHCSSTLAAAGVMPLDLPLALDVEEEGIDPADVLTWLEALGVGVLYCDQSFKSTLATACPELVRYPLWLACYQADMPAVAPWNRWTFWQHTSGGQVAGVPTPVDLDGFNGTLDELKALGRGGIVSS
jgi:lysozyme